MKKSKIGLWEAVSLAVGTMIGAGIFSILGVGAQICKSNLPLAFLLAAVISFSVAYSYSFLGSKFISNAGPIEFIIRGIGDNLLTGTLSILMWFSYVISISLFSKAFSGYFLALFHITEKPLYTALIQGGIILFFTSLNFFGSKAVGKAEFWIVMIKISVLLSFVTLGVWSINPELIKPNFSSKSIESIFFASSVLFLTYMGFGLITNASENIKDPEKNVPRAIYISIFIVAFVYISVSIVALGNLGVEGLIRSKEYALAEAAKPFLGDIGFTLVALGALFSTSSAINATLYGGANIAYVLSKKGHLPKVFERKVWFNEPEGLFITAFLSYTFALFFDLNGISALISFVFLIIYIFVIVSHYRLSEKAGGKKPLIMINLSIILSVFIILLIYQWNNQKDSFITGMFIVSFAFAFETLYRQITGRMFIKRKLNQSDINTIF